MRPMPHPGMLPFPLGDFKLRVRANAANSELGRGLQHLLPLGSWRSSPWGFVQGPGCHSACRGGNHPRHRIIEIS